MIDKYFVYIPKNVRSGIKRTRSYFPKSPVLVNGADTETCNGKIEMIQVCDFNGKVSVLPVNPNNALEQFVLFIDTITIKDCYNIIFFHNLVFDMEVMLEPYLDIYLLQKSLKLKIAGAEVLLNLGKTSFGLIQFSKNRKMHIRDSSNFIQGSLESVALKLGLKHKKMAKPQGLGVRSPWESDILEYAKNDAIVTKEIGDWIVNNLFKKYNTGIAVSFSHFSQKVYQNNYIDDYFIPFPPDSCVELAEKSYHGGKNGLYIPVPAFLPNVYEIDLISAYAYSLKAMPYAFDCKYIYINKYIPNVDGIFEIEAEISPFKYTFLFENRTFKPAVGYVKGLCLTSYELDKAISMGLIKIHKCRGWILQKQNDSHPFASYVDYWWDIKKRSTPGSVEYKLAKLGANAIYGKLIGKVETDNIDYIETPDGVIPNLYKYVASSFYNPFLASLITAKTRLKLLDLEIKYQALHSATDSVKSFYSPEENGTELGEPEVDVFGHCIILRNKFYLHFNKEGKLEKFALHGFWGSVEELINMIKESRINYKCQHMFKLRESMRMTNIKPTPFMMNEIERSIKVNLNEWYYIKQDRISKVTDIFDTEIREVII